MDGPAKRVTQNKARPEFGWQAFGGNVAMSGNTLTITPLDSYRQRVYLAPVGLWLTLDAGKFQSVSFDSQSRAVKVTFAPSDSFTLNASLRIDTISVVGEYAAPASNGKERGASVIPLGSSATSISLTGP